MFRLKHYIKTYIIGGISVLVHAGLQSRIFQPDLPICRKESAVTDRQRLTARMFCAIVSLADIAIVFVQQDEHLDYGHILESLASFCKVPQLNVT